MVINMKIAVATQGNQIFQHFGQCPAFTIITVENGIAQNKTLLKTAGNGHAALGSFLEEAGVNVVICGGIGGGAKNMLSAAGIRLISGIEGDIDEAVKAYLSGILSDQGGNCTQEEHGQHDCSGHSCG